MHVAYSTVYMYTIDCLLVYHVDIRSLSYIKYDFSVHKEIITQDRVVWVLSLH